MNAEKLLKKQGWRGAGHSLDPSNRGIAKPLLISHKQDSNGLGHKKAAWKTDDQWWMRAFDESLQNLGTGKSSTLEQVQEKGINRGGLYGFFVKGEGMQGTIGEDEGGGKSGLSTSTASAETSGTEDSEDHSESDEQSASSVSESSESSDSDAKNKKKRKRDADDNAPAQKKPKNEAISEPVSLLAEIETLFGVTTADDWPHIIHCREGINKQIKALTRIREKQGVYGLYISSEMAKSQKQFDDPTTGKRHAQKSAKYIRQKNLREAKKQMKKELLAKAMYVGDLPNNPNWEMEEALENWEKIEKAIDVIEKAYNELQRHKKETQKADDASAAELTHRNSILTSQLALLTPAKKAEYTARAAEKAQSLEDYVLRRVEKKAAKKAQEADAKAAARAAPQKAAKEAKKADALFFVDTTHTTPLVWTPLPDGTCPLDPTIWTGRVVKDLPKPVREARRQYMKLKRGKDPFPKNNLKAERKQKQLSSRTRQELTKAGKQNGDSKADIKEARRKAKKATRHEKKEMTGGVNKKLVGKMKTRHKVSAAPKERNRLAAMQVEVGA